MKRWSVGGAVIESSVLPAAVPNSLDGAPGVLMVQNLRRGGALDWTPPGGVIDGGESVIAGLTREVLEETGLSVREWTGPIYEIEAAAPGLGWELRVEVHRALQVMGTLDIGSDPDGIVVDADVLAHDDCNERMRTAHRWVREPLVDWMAHQWSGTRRYSYVVEGDDPSDLRILRVGDPET
ncbi:MAG: NUDIX domain-containing protein [Microthrixaceae bacterium]